MSGGGWTLTDAEMVRLSDAVEHTTDADCWNRGCDGSLPWTVARIKAEAVDRERAAWATKVEVLLLDWRGLPVWGPNTQGLMILDDVDSESLMADLRALLAADDTEAQA